MVFSEMIWSLLTGILLNCSLSATNSALSCRCFRIAIGCWTRVSCRTLLHIRSILLHIWIICCYLISNISTGYPLLICSTQLSELFLSSIHCFVNLIRSYFLFLSAEKSLTILCCVTSFSSSLSFRLTVSFILLIVLKNGILLRWLPWLFLILFSLVFTVKSLLSQF